MKFLFKDFIISTNTLFSRTAIICSVCLKSIICSFCKTDSSKKFLFFFFIAQQDVNSLRDFFIFLFMLSAFLFSLAVLVSQNPVFSALSLMATYVFSGFLLICLGLEIYGIYFILIYAGAISVLILFVIMMINLRFKEKEQSTSSPILFCWGFSITFIFGALWIHFAIEHLHNYLAMIVLLFLDMAWHASEDFYFYRAEFADVTNVFPALFTNNFLFILILSLIILLIGMLGSSFLVLSSKRN